PLIAWKAHIDGGTAAVFSPDGTQIVSGGRDNLVKVWEANSGLELRILKGHSAEVNSVAFSPDGRQIISGSSDGTIRIWDTAISRWRHGFKAHDSVHCLAVSPDGLRVISAGDEMKVWDMPTGRVLLTMTNQT